MSRKTTPMQTAQTQRPNKLWRASANDTAAPPQLLYEEPDEAFSLSLSQTHNQQHILLYGESMTTKYVMSLSAAQPEGDLPSGQCPQQPTCPLPASLQPRCRTRIVAKWSRPLSFLDKAETQCEMANAGEWDSMSTRVPPQIYTG